MGADTESIDAVGRWAVEEFRAMGSRCRVVAPGPSLATRGRHRVEELDRRWTRFHASELTRLNENQGHLCLISPDLHHILSVAETAHRLSGGLFDIRCLDAVVEAGYSSAYELRSGRPGRGDVVDEGVEVFDDPPGAVVPAGCRIDLGGIGKGLAADIVADLLRGAGAEHVQVELGGDIRVSGAPWDGRTWRVEVEDPRVRTRTVAELEIESGAVATSSVLRKRWVRDGRTSHHLIDPRTMRPADTDLVAVTAVADTAWRAEVAAKCALIAGRGRAGDVLAGLDAHGILFTADGAMVEVLG